MFQNINHFRLRVQREKSDRQIPINSKSGCLCRKNHTFLFVLFENVIYYIIFQITFFMMYSFLCFFIFEKHFRLFFEHFYFCELYFIINWTIQNYISTIIFLKNTKQKLVLFFFFIFSQIDFLLKKMNLINFYLKTLFFLSQLHNLRKI